LITEFLILIKSKSNLIKTINAYNWNGKYYIYGDLANVIFEKKNKINR